MRKIINSKSLTETDAIRIGSALMVALKEVARNRLVHRDLKPENVIVCKDGRVVLLDFGIARHLLLSSLTQDAAMFGPMTPGYAAPEQIKNEKRSISHRTDFFSWGVVMYEMLSGYNPFSKDCTTLGEVLTKTLTFEPSALTKCHPMVQFLIAWCLKKQPHRRPANASIIIDRLREVL